MQRPALHVNPGLHGFTSEHAVTQRPAPHSNGAHERVVPGTHTPGPRQCPGAVSMPFVQLSGLHSVPTA